METGSPVTVLTFIPQYKLKKGQQGIFIKTISSWGIKEIYLIRIDGQDYSLLEEEFEEIKEMRID